MAGYQVNFTLFQNKFTPVYFNIIRLLFKMIIYWLRTSYEVGVYLNYGD
jgi:hypothetical protein